MAQRVSGSVILASALYLSLLASFNLNHFLHDYYINALQGLQKQLQRAEPLLSINGVNYQCAVFSHLQQTTYGFVSVGTHYCELK